MTEDNRIKEWESYKQKLLEMPDPHIESNYSWNDIRSFRIRAIEGLLTGKTLDAKTPGKPYH